MNKIQIDTEWGPVTERYRLQAAYNMRANPLIKLGVEKMLGVEVAKQRYPEAYVEDEPAGEFPKPERQGP